MGSFACGYCADTSSRPVRGGQYSVRVVKDLAYFEGSDADSIKHRLDLYLPRGAESFPTVLFVHGGGWRTGDKNFLFDIYGKLASLFARNGVGCVVTNYRLSPKVKHPEHVKDVARAFAWTHKHLPDYGGNAKQIFVMGHSAGGHLCTLLAADETYLGDHGLKTSAIKGVLGLSGVYEINAAKSFFPSVFGDDPEVRRLASPVHHVRTGLPPFLLLYGDSDFPTLDRLARQFHSALRTANVESEVQEMKKRDHFSMIGLMIEQDDPVFQASLQFIARHANLKLEALAETGR